MTPNNIEEINKEEIRKLAIQLYLKLPFWKRWQYVKWHKSNGWDVKKVFRKCTEEARFLLNDYIY